MSSKTTNFNLHKIDLTDAPPDITVLNGNFDTIDTQLKSVKDSVGNAVTKTGNHVMAGTLTVPGLSVKDGSVTTSIISEGAFYSGLFAVSTDQGDGMLTVSPYAVKFTDKDWNERELLHTGNFTRLMGAMSASLE
jgi:hypothetical protein